MPSPRPLAVAAASAVPVAPSPPVVVRRRGLHLRLTLAGVLLAAAISLLCVTTATATAADRYTSTLRKKNLTVGYLTAIKGDLKERQGLAVSGALTYALDEVNNNPKLLPYVNLVVKWNDTRGDEVVATRAITEMICEGVAVFFGPEGTCYVEAIVAQSRNIPMISYKCSDYKASSVPTFARTEPPDTQVTKSVIALLRYYGWNKFSVFHEQSWETVANSLRDQAKSKNMTINGMQMVMDSHKCCEKKMLCCQSGYWYQTIQETKNLTRIYVFLGTPMTLIDMMNTMHTAQLFDNGEYMVIYVDMNTYSMKEAQKYLWRPEDIEKNETCHQQQRDFEKRAKSLLVVVSTKPLDNYENFTKKVSDYNGKEPFNFTIPPILNNFQKFVSIYAAYLYDSVFLYARALDELLKNHKITDELIEEVASNGTKIIETIIKMGKYRSVTGTEMHVDMYGDSEGNFSVLALQKMELRVNNFSCTYQMVPVGIFHQQGDSLEYKLRASNSQIDWPGGMKPEDEPSCGFDNRSCPKDDNYKSKIASGILGILLFCAIVVTASIYRKWKIEQEIEGLLWKIDAQEIHNYFGNDIISSPSKLSLTSASVTSYESRCGAQVFAATGHYKGLIVRIKELKFSKKKDISRDVMKEMRLLREIRHDNINSFIGACVEPMRILLVTDYCAKGSLYDIIENEDIKLDNMFIASLVHDLIRGMLYIHNSMLMFHGNLKSSNCVVTSRWILQITDFGLIDMRHCAENDSIGEHQYYRSLFWKAPELLRDSNTSIKGSQKADVFAFAIILYEIIGRRGPFGFIGYEPKEIVELIKHQPMENEEPFRPDLNSLLDSKPSCEEFVLQCMKDCWAEQPDLRPDFVQIRTRLKKMKDGKHRNIMDQLMDMMVKYADNLEDLVSERTRLLIEEKMKTEDLLHRMLPEPVAKRLTRGYGVEPESFDLVTIYFSDIVGFTAMSAESTPLQVVNFLNDLYTVFDQIIKGYDVYKVETIGDAYMVVSGLPLRNGDKHAGEIASMALDLLSAVKMHTIAHRPNETLKLRIGIHTGPVVAGVVGLTMPRYCLFGDTVNTASRMESNGEALKIHISPQCKDALDKLGGYITEDRGLVNMKGKGEVRTFWLEGADDKAIQRREVDLGQLPPLFCRPRRSPKLNTESRQASICGALGFGGVGTRRHSSIPRGTSIDVESTSTLHNTSPIPVRNFHTKRMERLHPYLADVSMSRLSLSTCAFGSEISETPETFGERSERRPRRTRTVLSSIASSADDHREFAKSQGMLNKIRESRSMDPIPSTTQCQHLEEPVYRPPRRSSSLENYKLVENIINNNSFPNGNVVPHPEADNLSVGGCEDVEVPLLRTPSLCDNIAIIQRRRAANSGDGEGYETKRWRSLEVVPAGTEQQVIDSAQNKKQISRNSLKNWIVGLFNGNGLRASNASLRKGVLQGYNDLQTEKESIV